MNIDYNNLSLVEIDRLINKPKEGVILDGKSLSLNDIHLSSKNLTKVKVTDKEKVIERIAKSHEVMLQDVKNGLPVYGTNSSFGGQAGRILNRGDQMRRVIAAREISKSLVFLDIGVGPKVPQEIVRAAMTIRINMLMQGVSGVRLLTLKRYSKLLNKNIIPIVNSYGGIGASGDLAHNQRIVSVLRGLPGAKVINERGRIEEARNALLRNNIPLLELDPKEGLALVNGDNFSTAFAANVSQKVVEYLLLCEVAGAMAIEVLKGSDRSFHPLLSGVRPHKGQHEASATYRYLLKGSRLAHQELKGHKIRPTGVKVQDGYSLRCLSQFEGIMIEKIKWGLNTVTVNANGVSDNPLWVPEEYATTGEVPWQWVSGGNFLAMHMVEVLDAMRKITTQLVKRNDRHLARMIDIAENNGLPANLSNSESVSQCTFKGIQIQSGMLEVYSMSLANPISVLFGIHEERNQDITSHAVTSGILALKNLELLRYSLAQNLLAIAQGVDLRGGPRFLSIRTRPMYQYIRELSKMVKRDRPLHGDIEKIAESINNGGMMKMAREEIYNKI